MVGREKNLPALYLHLRNIHCFAPPWVGLANVTHAPLSRLPEQDAAELVRNSLGGEALGSELIASVVSKTDGIPLYVLEYSKAVAQTRQARKPAISQRRSTIYCWHGWTVSVKPRLWRRLPRY